MAMYRYKQFLSESVDKAFDDLHKPGQPVPHSGIYRCHGCGREIAANEPDPFPPQNHHQHTQAQGHIQWRLVVYADHKPK